MVKTCPRRSIGAMHQRALAASSCSAMTRMLQQVLGTIGPPTISRPIKWRSPKALPEMAIGSASNKRSTTSKGQDTVALVRPAAMDFIIIILDFWPCRPTACRSVPNPLAERSSEKRASLLSPKQHSSGFINDDEAVPMDTERIIC